VSKLKAKNRAFSLLELIIGVGILSVGLVMVLQALSFSARVTGLVCDMTRAVFLTKDLIGELEFEEKQNLIKEKAVKDKKDKFDWEYSIELSPDLTLPDLKIYKLDFNITWHRLNREEKIGLNTYLRE